MVSLSTFKDPWEPTVVDDKIESVATAGEAEYPKELAEAIADGVIAFLEKGATGSFDFDFMEIFSGPNGPLSSAMECRNVGSGAASSSGTSLAQGGEVESLVRVGRWGCTLVRASQAKNPPEPKRKVIPEQRKN